MAIAREKQHRGGQSLDERANRAPPSERLSFRPPLPRRSRACTRRIRGITRCSSPRPRRCSIFCPPRRTPISPPPPSRPSSCTSPPTRSAASPIAVLFMPDGRRLLTCSQNGEFTMWNGMSFNFETILQAHNCAIRAAAFSHNENWLISATTPAGAQALADQPQQPQEHLRRALGARARRRFRFHGPQVLLVLGRHDGQGVGFRARADDLRAHGSRRRRPSR